MHKSDVIRWYVRALSEQPDPGAASLKPRIASVHEEIPFDGAADGLLVGAAWHIDQRKPWRSYVVQALNLTAPEQAKPVHEVFAILIDTATYVGTPDLIPWPNPNAGATGDIPDPEAKIIKAWAKQIHERNAVLILMGHHPYDSLTSRGKRVIDELRQRYRLAIYVSAHTHKGRWFAHGFGDDGKSWPELNVGSVLDAPVEVRDFFVKLTDSLGSKERVVVVSNLLRMEEELEQPDAPACRDHTANGPAPSELWDCAALAGSASWEAVPEDPDYYLAYNQLSSPSASRTAVRLYKGLLRSYQRMLNAIPSDPDASEWPAAWTSDVEVCARIKAVIASGDHKAMQALLVELAAFDEGVGATRRIAADPAAQHDYRICQAWWAAKYDRTAGRVPDVEDISIVLPE